MFYAFGVIREPNTRGHQTDAELSVNSQLV